MLPTDEYGMTDGPDLILTRANVLTMQSVRPFAEAVAIAGGRILATGDAAEVAPMRTASTQVIDCGGRLVIPGIVDAHLHFLSYAASLLSVDCSPRATPGLADIQTAVRQRAACLPPGTWVRATGYDETALAGRHPTRHDLDAAAPDHPVRLVHRSGHAVVLNSLALRRAGISNETEEPPGGYMERDLATGEPAGLLMEMNELVDRAVPPIAEPDLAAAVAEVGRRLLREGVTAFQDATHTNGPAEFALFERFMAEGRIPQRVSLMEGYESFVAGQRDLRPSSPADRPFVHRGPVKIMLRELGDSVWPGPDALNEMVLRVHAAGRQVAIHAVGQPAVRRAADAIEAALAARPASDHRHRIEHCGVCPPDLAARLGALGVAVVMQPAFLYESGDRYARTVPPGDLPHLYPVRRLRDAGCVVASSSDVPVASPDLGPRITGVTSRTGRQGTTLNAEERVDIVTALRMATVDAAFDAQMERVSGVIAPGRQADLVVLSCDSTERAGPGPDDLRAEMVILRGTVCDGQGVP
jgi:predicted amidohydrolase YtcJ